MLFISYIEIQLLPKPTKPPATVTTPTADPSERPPLPPPDPPPLPKPPAEPFKPNEEPNIFLEKPAFIPPPKPISHSPKISPSSIPNPSPSVTTNKQVEPGYPNYSNFLYNIPGYSAFQPVSFPGMIQQNQAIPQNESGTDFVPFPPKTPKDTGNEEKSNTTLGEAQPTEPIPPKIDTPKSQTDFEDHFTPEIIPAVPISEKNKFTECKMSITSLAQGSGGTITIPAQVTQIPQMTQASEAKKKPNERFSLKTSIPISKIDMKCVNNQPDNILQSSLAKKTIQSQPFLNQKVETGPRVEIQSNIVIKKPDISITKEPEIKPVSPMPIPVPERKTVSPMSNNSINALINAAEVINKNESQFRKPEPKPEGLTDIKDASPTFMPQTSTAITRSLFNPINIESNKVNFTNKPTEGYNEQKNQILFIQNKNPSNPKMLLTIQQQNPQVLLQRTNFDSKNLQAPSRLSSQTKKSKDEINENGSSSKVVALKRLHQENCDENDFENLITENQIYGNKIVVKEKSQGTLQEQDLKNKIKIDKPMQTETKNVVLQPNFLYLSNVQFPNLMMIKNNPKVAQNNDTKINKQSPNENKTNEVNNKLNPDQNLITQNQKTQTVAVSKEIHVLKSSNNVLQTLSNKNNKTDLVFQTSTPKVIMSPQIVYQVPMIVDADNKLIQQSINREYPKFVNKQKEHAKQLDQGKQNDKLFIACPYQVDTKLQPKIVITNIRPKISKVEEVSTLDLYEKRRRIRRLKYLTNREVKDQKIDKDPKVKETAEKDTKKLPEKVGLRNVITPAKMKAEIYKEFTRTRETVEEESSESESDYEEEEIGEYESIINEYSVQKDDQSAKAEFLSNFMLATHEMRKDKEMDKQERMFQRDSVAAAYITVGRLDRLYNEDNPETPKVERIPPTKVAESVEKESPATVQRKQTFLKQLQLAQVSAQCRDGYEKTWQEIMKERNRRNGITQPQENASQPATENMELDPNGQLQLLTEIKKSVNDNNNLIKLRLDSPSNNDDGDSIKVLAEKNFSELNRLSKMADQSVKIFSGQDTKKRDLNPGFDSENIQKAILKLNPIPNYASLKIPSISKIISLKSREEESVVTTTPATSMDEPKNCAAGTEIFDGNKRDFCCQFEDMLWPGIEAVAKSFRELEAARKKEISELHRRNTALRVESAHITRNASRDSERARALLAERQHLATEENALRASVQRICAAIELVRDC